MAYNIINKLFNATKRTRATYMNIVVSSNKITFTSDSGRKKKPVIAKSYIQTRQEIDAIECLLESFDETNILFAGGIKSFSYKLSDGRSASYLRIDDGIVSTVKVRKSSDTKLRSYDFLRFISNDNPFCGVAFQVNNAENPELMQRAGSVLNGIMPSGLKTDLQFVVSADLKTCNGILNPKFESSNSIEIKNVTTVFQNALMRLRIFGLHGMPLFSILPSNTDADNQLTRALRRVAESLCESYYLFEDCKNQLVCKDMVMLGTKEVINLFPEQTYKKITGNKKYWIESENSLSRAESFLMNVGIPYYDREHFLIMLFNENHDEKIKDIISTKSDKWIRKFYDFCEAEITDSYVRERINQFFQRIEVVGI